MVNIVLASHGPMAEAMIKSSQMLYGKSEYVHSVCLYEEDNIKTFGQSLRNVIEPDKEVLLLVDIPGGTPSNEGMKLLTEYPHLRIISGMNLMMLLECLVHLETADVDELMELAISSSRESVHQMKITQMSEDDELDNLME